MEHGFRRLSLSMVILALAAATGLVAVSLSPRSSTAQAATISNDYYFHGTPADQATKTASRATP